MLSTHKLYSSVITGVRFIVQQGVLFLQPQVGELGPMGTVYQNTVYWQPIPDNFARDVSNFEQKNNYFGMDKFWFEGNYLTGLQFTKSSGTLRLRVFGKTIDAQSFAFGLMKKKEDSKFKSNSNQIHEEIKLDSMTEGLATGKDISYPDFKIIKDKELVFGQQTVGESLLKFFDTSEASFDIKSPIAGIGFYLYTNSDGHIGFIRPYLVAMDYRNFITMEID
jgi:hypothetical protein